MIELELLGANGDRVVMTDKDGERYQIVVDDALRGAVRRARPTVTAPPAPAARPGAVARPRDLQALMRAGATAQEVAQATGSDIEHVRRFEGPVLAERAWAVEQARACRIGWGKDSPVLGDLVLDRLATRGVEPTSLTWDALRHGRDPWQIVLTFVQGAEEKEARWELDLSARSVAAQDDEARWLTEAAASRAARVTRMPAATEPARDQAPAAHALAPADPSPAAARQEDEVSQTDALLDALSASRGQRVDVDLPEPTGLVEQVGRSSASVQDEPRLGTQDLEPEAPASAQPTTQTRGRAQEGGAVVPLPRRRTAQIGHHPAGSRLPAPSAAGETEEPRAATAVSPVTSGPAPSSSRPGQEHPSFESIVTGVTDVVARAAAAQTAHPDTPAPATGAQDVQADPATAGDGDDSAGTRQGQDPLPQMPAAPAPRPRRRPRRSVPSWDEIVFGAKPE